MFKYLICFSVFLMTGSFCFSQEYQLYVNRAWAFQNTNEFYIPLKLPDSLEKGDITEYLKSQLDSAVVSNTYVTRRLLPLDTAAAYFNLDLLQHVSIYTEDHQLVTRATLKRVEYYEDMIEGMFIAVFEAASPTTGDMDNVEFYATAGNFSPYKTDVKTEVVSKKKMDENIRKNVYFNEDNLMVIRHLSIKHLSKDVLSILSIQDPETLRTASYLFSQSGPQLAELYKTPDDYVLWDVLPIPVSANRMPVLLVEIVTPATESTSYQLAVFNGTRYELIDDMLWSFR